MTLISRILFLVLVTVTIPTVNGQHLERFLPISQDSNDVLSILLTTNVIFQATDIATTYYILSRGGHEENSFMQPILDKPALVVGIKLATILGLNYWANTHFKESPTIVFVVVAILDIFGSVVVFNNLKICVTL